MIKKDMIKDILLPCCLFTGGCIGALLGIIYNFSISFGYIVGLVFIGAPMFIICLLLGLTD
jgi:hypothetical protein